MSPHRRIAVLAVASLLVAGVVPAAFGHPVSHAGPPRVRNLRPAFGEVVAAGPRTIAAQVVSDVAITGHRLLIDGNPVNARREGDPTHPTVAADVTLKAGDHVAQVEVTGSDGRTSGRAWRFTVSDLSVRRLAGADRLATAVAVSQDLYPTPGTARTAVLARADDFADALAGAALAQQGDGPVLLSERARLSPGTADELRRAVLPGSTVYLLGGTAALSDQVASDVSSAGFVPRRLAGTGRAGTAVAVAEELGRADGAVVVNGGAFADALSASSPSAHGGLPVLLASRDAVPAETRAFLEGRRPARVYVVGGEGVVSEAVAGQLRSWAGDVTRVAGADRYATSIAVARAFFSAGAPVGVASGATFPDALAGGRLAAAGAGPLLLSPRGGLSDLDAVGTLTPSAATLVGGTAALSDTVAGDLRRAAGDVGAPRLVGADPFPGVEVHTVNTFSLTFDRELNVAASNVYVTMAGEEVSGSLESGDFDDTLVFTAGEIPVSPPAGVPVDVRVVVAAYDGARWRHLDFHLTYRKLDLARGDSGEAVLNLQRRLAELGYWLGTPDGTFGALTYQAVLAIQKANGLPRDGVVGASTRAALSRGARPSARSASGNHVEIDKARQLLLIVRDGRVAWILNTSTGTERPYTYDGQTYTAHTPTGTFSLFRQIDGVRESRLGTLYRPKYFTNDGVAIHGSSSVPPYPASHGCVRLTNAAMDWVWGENLMPIGTRVVVY